MPLLYIFFPLLCDSPPLLFSWPSNFIFVRKVYIKRIFATSWACGHVTCTPLSFLLDRPDWMCTFLHAIQYCLHYINSWHNNVNLKRNLCMTDNFITLTCASAILMRIIFGRFLKCATLIYIHRFIASHPSFIGRKWWASFLAFIIIIPAWNWE